MGTSLISHICLLLAAACLLSGCQSSRPLARRSKPSPPAPVQPSAVVLAQHVEVVEDAPASTDAVVRASAEVIEVPDAWTLESLEAWALEHSPAIRQANATIDKAMGYRTQVGLHPNPQVGYNATQLADQNTDQHTAFVEQDIVLGRKLQRNRAVLDQEVQVTVWKADVQRLRLLTDIRQQYYTALAAQRRSQLAEEFATVAQEGGRLAALRQEAGEGSRTDTLQAEIQLQQVQLQKKQADAAYEQAWRRLAALANLPTDCRAHLTGELGDGVGDRDWAAVELELLVVSPELKAAEAELIRAQTNLDRQQAQVVPNVSVMLAGGKDNSTDSGMINAEVGVTLPVYNKNQGNIAAARAEVCRAAQNVERVRLSLKARLAAVASDYEVALVAVKQYREAMLPRAQEALKLAEQAYGAGEYGFFQVFLTRRTYFDANMEYVQALSQLAQAEALVDGLLLSGGLDAVADVEMDAGLRDAALSTQ